MELHPGVFVSNVLTDDWQPDPEVGGEIHVLVEEETAYCGMSRFTTRAGLERWTLPVARGARGNCSDRDRRWSDPGTEGRRYGVTPEGRVEQRGT